MIWLSEKTVGLAIGLILGATIVGCGPAGPAIEEGGPRNLLVILCDAMRADRLGCYGYERPTSPAIDRLAAEGVVFERAMSASSFTPESVAAVFQGMAPSAIGNLGVEAAPNDRYPTLMSKLSGAGWRCGVVAGTYWLADEHFLRGVDYYEQFLSEPITPRINEAALNFVGESPAEPFALYLHYLDPHGPYEPSAESRAMFAETGVEEPLKLYTDIRPDLPALIEDGFGPGHPQFEDMSARYDAEIRDVDAAIGRMLDGLDELGVLEETVVVLISDHGEEFLDHGYVEHSWTLFDESLHVPLIIRHPKELAPARHAERVSLVDLYPTLMTIFDLPLDDYAGGGNALFEREDEAWTFQPREDPLFADLGLQTRSLIRTVVEDDWKLISARKWLTIEQRSAIRELNPFENRERLLAEGGELIDPWAPPVREELYDLRNDPSEQDNLLAGDPSDEARERLESLRRMLDGFRDYCRGLEQSGGSASRTMNAEEREALKRLGYL